MRIYLVGFMGSGKSHVSKQLAMYLGFPFVDLDHLIEAHAGKHITAIFQQEGEASFRKTEAAILRKTQLFQNAVIGCGGGTPCYHDNMSWMNEHGMTVFLDVDEAILERRLEQEADTRPLLQTGESIQSIIHAKLSERRSFYEQAHLNLAISDEQTNVAQLISEHFFNIIGH